MKNLSTELKVGLLMLVGMSLIVYASVVVTGWRPGVGDTYKLFIYFDSVSGLLAGSPVQVAGVKIGQVETIGLEDGRAKVTVSVYRTQKLAADSTASIKSLGILGDKYIDIVPGSASSILQDGNTIVRTVPGRDLDSLVESLGGILGDFRTVSASLRETLGSDRGRERLDNILEQIARATKDISRISDATNQQIDVILGNLTRFTANLERITEENRGTLRDTLANLAEFTAELRDLTQANRERLDAILANLDTFSAALAKDGPGITSDLRQVLAENKQSLNNAVTNLDRSFAKLDKTMGSLESISAKMDEGKGSLGKLINDETTVDELNNALSGLNRFLTEADRIKLDVGGHVEYLVDQGEYKSYFTVKVQPLKDRYYLLQLVDNPRGKVEEKTIITDTGGTTTETRQTTVTDRFQLSLIIAQRYYDTVLKGGLFESTFGLGVDQYFGSEDQYRIGLDVWDFSNTLGPHVKLTGYWRFYSNAFVVVGGDDLANEKPEFRDAFFGIGVSFNEDSLKTLMAGGLPVSGIP